jgi:bifunctional ADP-heptose synthase (sugar kinase/adenylyltransferase)
LSTKFSQFGAQTASHDVLMVPDLGKGGLTHVGEMIQMALAAGKPVFIDSKGED